MIDYEDRITVLPSATLSVEYLTTGIKIETKRAGAAGATLNYTLPFEFVPTTGIEFKLRYGLLTLGLTERADAAVVWDGGYPDNLSGAYDLVPSATHVWSVGWAIDRSAETVTLFNGGARPANTDTIEYWLLAEGTTNAADTEIATQRQAWTGGDIRITLFG